MEARIVTFPNRHSTVRVAGDRVEVEALSFIDGPLAGWLAAQPADDHSILVERAIRIGLIPPLAVYWRLRGALAFRVRFL